MADNKQTAGKGPKDDAKGQFVQTRHGADNSGVTSADPRVLSGKEDGDATFPIKKENSRQDRQPSQARSGGDFQRQAPRLDPAAGTRVRDPGKAPDDEVRPGLTVLVMHP